MHLYREHFVDDRDFESRDDLFRFVSKTLELRDFVTSEFGDALIEREASFPTGLESEINFAIPHSEDEYVYEDTFMVILPKSGVVFNSMIEPTKEILAKVIIVLVIKNKHKHISFLQKVIELFQSHDSLKEALKKNHESRYNFFHNYFEGV